MRPYEWTAIAFFLAFILLAWRRPLDARRRVVATAFGVIGAASLILVHQQPVVVRDWLPAVLLPIAYWQTGQFGRPIHQRLQARLWQFDRKVLRQIGAVRAGALSAWLRSLLELAYLLCYPFVPCGFAVLYLYGMREHATEFWNVVIPAAYVCYGTFPFFQTLPPRSIEEAGASRPQAIRGLNLTVLRYLSVQANTFPSGHVAASLGVALVLVRHTPSIGILFLIVAVGIAGGAFIGRYHYALDVLVGGILAAVSFLVVVL